MHVQMRAVQIRGMGILAQLHLTPGAVAQDALLLAGVWIVSAQIAHLVVGAP
jgi:hypothetical protein